ncbi:hypothetical protein Ddc_04992 [Ditylenchus destructor]|nr:hypothetical protein Ddc_04992 [Ditylenchus destructor]
MRRRPSTLSHKEGASGQNKRRPSRATEKLGWRVPNRYFLSCRCSSGNSSLIGPPHFASVFLEFIMASIEPSDQLDACKWHVN